jgi:cytochrome b561
MAFKDSPENYGTVARWLHWSTALLILASYCTVYYRHWFTEEQTAANWNALQLHLSVGLTVGVLVLLRILWRLYNHKPKPEPGTALQHQAAHIGHIALYAVLIIMPITGYLGTGINTDFFLLGDIPGVKETAIHDIVISDCAGADNDDCANQAFKAFEKPIDFIHKKILGEWLAWILILGHIGFALYHHLAIKDRTLAKMSSIKQRQ